VAPLELFLQLLTHRRREWDPARPGLPSELELAILHGGEVAGEQLPWPSPGRQHQGDEQAASLVGSRLYQAQLVIQGESRPRLVRWQWLDPDRPPQSRLGPVTPLQEAEELADQEQAVVAG
jgi:hypothetical protein